MVHTQCCRNIKTVRTNNEIEFVNNHMKKFTRSKGIEHQTTYPRIIQQNEVSERKNKHILNIVRSMMFKMNVPSKF